MWNRPRRATVKEETKLPPGGLVLLWVNGKRSRGPLRSAKYERTGDLCPHHGADKVRPRRHALAL